jgi:hypothetical protein
MKERANTEGTNTEGTNTEETNEERTNEERRVNEGRTKHGDVSRESNISHDRMRRVHERTCVYERACVSPARGRHDLITSNHRCNALGAAAVH